MLYGLLKLIATTSVRTFFRRISPQNVDRIPAKGPVVFVCNHPNTMIDPLLVGISCKRKLFFFAKSTLFKGKLASWLLPKLQLIPVYRKQDDPSQTGKNTDTFSMGYKILEQNRAFLIFPEGISDGERRLNKIKTGAARIGFGAMVNNNWDLDVTIVPVGLSYSNVIKFKSNVIVRYGNPIHLNEYKEKYQSDEIETVREITGQIETALSKLTTYINVLESEEIVNALELIYKKELMQDLGLDTKNKSDEFSATKGLVRGVEWYFKNKPAKVEEFKRMLQSYQEKLDLLKLKDEFLNPTTKSITLIDRFIMLLYIILGFPLFIYGLINNFIPYKVPRWLTRKLKRTKSEIASTKLLAGIVMFLVYYGIEIFLFYYLVDNNIYTILYALSLVPSGNFALSYLFYVRRYRQHLRFFTIFYKKRDIMYQIIEQRRALIEYINQARDEYLKIEKLD